MAIIEFSTTREQAPADAVWCNHHRVWTWRTHVGLCLQDRERNGYDDSDFYMTVWDEAAQAPREIMFATTRGWSYPSYGSFVDATPEVVAKWEAWKAAREAERRKEVRRCRARLLLANRALWRAAADRHGLSSVERMRFRRLPDWQALLTLFNMRNRNKLKLSLRQQVIDWCKDPSPKYSYPLSRKQRSFVG